jgi:hypothetical protein
MGTLAATCSPLQLPGLLLPPGLLLLLLLTLQLLLSIHAADTHLHRQQPGAHQPGESLELGERADAHQALTVCTTHIKDLHAYSAWAANVLQ